jgi:hypothetical protein
MTEARVKSQSQDVSEILEALPELKKVEAHIAEFHANFPDLVRSKILAYSQSADLRLPIYGIELGSTDPQAPVLGWTGGVHGIERIGAEVVIALMSTLGHLLQWDEGTRELLKHIRVFFVPIVNPIGVKNHTRSNPNGVDLMRNAPIEGSEAPLLVGGHRISNKLPWYRGPLGAPMEIESKALVEYVGQQIERSAAAVVVDVHSGFGMTDRLWFPYSKTVTPFPGLAHVGALYDTFRRTYPHHFYIVEPQSTGYTINGDLWDYIYDQHRDKKGNPFVPLCLEMGSWNWVKKNPWQIFSLKGPFNPIVEHRQRRTLRRHNTLFEFLLRSIRSFPQWARLSDEQQKFYENLALREWYGVESKYGKQQARVAAKTGTSR